MKTKECTAEQAMAWFTRSREGELSATERQRLMEWLTESPLHVREYLDTAKIWGALHSEAVWPSGSKEDFLSIVREAHEGRAVASLGPAAQGIRAGRTLRGAGGPVSRPRRLLLYAVAAGVFALTSMTLGWWYWHAKASIYETARGEQRYVVLPDGSSVQLNTLTKVVVRFDERQRRIELRQGEALFRAEQDAVRPFEVATPHARVRALGTEFNVYNRREGTRVAVIEGRVRIVSTVKSSRERGSGSFVDLNPHQAVEVDAHGQVAAPQSAKRERLESGGVEPEIAWIRRRIVLDGDNVATAVEQFNRYNVKQIRIDDPQLAGLRITGVFNADDPIALLKYLQEIRPLEVTETDAEFRVHR